MGFGRCPRDWASYWAAREGEELPAKGGCSLELEQLQSWVPEGVDECVRHYWNSPCLVLASRATSSGEAWQISHG